MIWQIHGSDARDMTLQLLEACEAHRLVPHGGSVALKPNLVLAAVPEDGAVTHPGVVSGCIEYFRAHGVACSACYAALVRALYASGRGRNQDIYIGQGWDGSAPRGLGIGRCCRGAEQCVPGCPPTAESIARRLHP